MAAATSADEPALVQPGHVKPAAPKPRPVTQPAEPADEAPAPGQLVCPECGRGNDQDRRFCRRCGASLAAASTARPARDHWWQRPFRRQRRPIAAGERPASLQRNAAKAAAGHRGPWSGLARGTVLVAVGAAAGVAVGYVAIPDFGAAINDAVDQVRVVVAPRYTPVRPATYQASSAADGHPVGAAFDEGDDTYWAALPRDAQPSIRAEFAPPVSVEKLLITSGPSTAQPRPSRIEVSFLDAHGRIVDTRRFDLLNTKAVQILDVAATGASTFRLVVLEAYPSAGGGGVAIAEVEFQARS